MNTSPDRYPYINPVTRKPDDITINSDRAITSISHPYIVSMYIGDFLSCRFKDNYITTESRFPPNVIHIFFNADSLEEAGRFYRIMNDTFIGVRNNWIPMIKRR